MNILIIVVSVLTFSFWVYLDVFYRANLLPYRFGYLIFAVFQWILVLINSIWIWGWMMGLVYFVVLFTLGIITIGNITNQIYRKLNLNPTTGLSLFSFCIYTLTALTIIKIFT